MNTYISEIASSDLRGLEQLRSLLIQEGLQEDENLDFRLGLYDENGCLLATGSSFQNTLRCLAVSREYQGEGLLNQIITRLLEYQFQQGFHHTFVVTKPQNARFFRDFGFTEIARAQDAAVFLENRKTGFSDYLAALPPAKGGAAIVLNANPFTLGHRFLIEKAAEENPSVHLFLLSQEAGPIPFAIRKKLVLDGIRDLPNVVFHESGPYLISVSTFPGYFFKDSDSSIRAGAALDSAVFHKIASHMGLCCRYVGEEPLSHTTAIYNQVLLESLPPQGIQVRLIPRYSKNGRIISASAVRMAIQAGRLEEVRDMLTPESYEFWQSPEASQDVLSLQQMKDPVHH